MKSFLTKALLGASIIGGSLTTVVAPAKAGTCWFQANYTTDLQATYCYTNQRLNANGHNVIDVRDHQGTEFTIVFWDNGTAEMIYSNTVYKGTVLNLEWYADAQGDRRLMNPNNDWEMAISLSNPN